ncbi:hypothetical protein A2115_02485 [Candidatus Woesebacteria bacterium GWA1_41_8]|uniref:Glutamyl-tRNA amidotransferase n=1 Tax=Candidatus Woesebacteria bacterium GWA1_41_8 TaxID=1802471 RepID=A0A1F7WHL3_9BACT|nr:MAG: hypothetical protein A2115_02485 [Candidatus Woesebacteria bacterium GWA1_41_8]
MIVGTINQKIAQALKAKDEIRLSTLRLLSSALNYEFIAKQHKLSDEEELVVVQKEAKKRKDAIEAYEKVNALDRAEKEKKEMAILYEFLPAQMSDENLTKLVEEAVREAGASAISDMGKVMGLVMTKVQGRADGGRVSALVKQKLSV